MSLRYILDTNICIYIAKKNPISVQQKLEQLSVGEVCISTITYGQLQYGVQKSHHPKKSLFVLEGIIGLIPPLPISTEVAEHYGIIRAKLEKVGKPIGNNDLWIAAHALTLDLILVTNYVNEFSRVPHLKIENWVNI